MSTSYRVYVDWENDGNYTGTYDDVSADVRHGTGINVRRGRDNIRPLTPPAAGAGDFSLDNQDNTYSADYLPGPLQGLLVPGRPVRVLAQVDPSTYDLLALTGSPIIYNDTITYEDSDNNYGGDYSIYDAPGVPYDGVSYPLMTGLLNQLQQAPDIGKQSVTAPVLGKLSRLVGKKLTTTLYSSVLTSDAITTLLAAAGFSADEYVIHTGNTTLSYWWMDDADAFQELLALVASEGPGSALYEDGDGRVIFEGRSYRQTATRSISAQAVFASKGSAEPKYSRLAMVRDTQSVINEAKALYRKRSAKTLAAIWSLSTTVTLGNNEVRTFIAYDTTNGDPFTGAVTPSTANGDITASAGAVTAALSRTSGGRTTITLTAGAAGCTITALRLRAQVVSVDEEAMLVNAFDTSDSQATYGVQTVQLSVKPEVDLVTLQGYVDLVAQWYQVPKLQLHVTVISDDNNPTRLLNQLQRQISDRVRIVNTAGGLDKYAFIETISHRVLQGNKLETTLGCEETYRYGTYGIWDTSLWDGSALWGF